MIPMMIFGMAMQAAQAASQSHQASELNKMQSNINPQDPKYNTSPYAQQRLGLAQTLLNSRMPGASAMERNIYGNQANQLDNVNRNATSGSQALAMGAAAQGQSNQAFQNLGVQEQQDYYNRLQNVTGAQAGMTQEGDKVHADQLRDYQEKMQLKNTYLAASMQNKNTSLNSWANTGYSAGGAAASLPPNFWQTMFKKKGAPGFGDISGPDQSGQMGGLFSDVSGGDMGGVGSMPYGIGGMNF